MSWFDLRSFGLRRLGANRAGAKTAGRLAVIAALAAFTAGCFQPMYAERSDGKPALRERLQGVEIPQLNYPNASREARVGLNIRNALMFNLYGDGVGGPPTHRLLMRLTTSRSSIIVDNTTSLPEVENYGIDVVYELKDNNTDKTVLTGQTFARVSYNIPGQEQRYAKSRGLRDAEDRAAKTIADNITTRLASFLYAGT
jgi:LPS-assembly lipoprotein